MFPLALSRDGVAGLTSSRPDALKALGGVGSEMKAVCCSGIADRRQRSEARRASGSHSVLIVPLNPGNAPPERTRGREARRRNYGP
jgi:hypothetical protein